MVKTYKDIKYKIWNKSDKINGVDAQHFIDNLHIREDDEVFLIMTGIGDDVKSVEISRIIKGVYNLDLELSVEEVTKCYIDKIIEQEDLSKKAQAEEMLLMERVISLEEENKQLKEGLRMVLSLEQLETLGI